MSKKVKTIMMLFLGIVAFCMLTWAGEDTAITICAIIGGIIAIPGGILGAAVDGIFGFSIAGLLNSTIGSMLDNAIGRFVANAIRFFLLPFIIAVIIFVIAA